MRPELFDAQVLKQDGTQSERLLDSTRIPRKLVAKERWVTNNQAYDMTYNFVLSTEWPEAVFMVYRNFEL